VSLRLADPGRILKFGIVGISGVGVNTFFLWFFTEVGNLYYLLSSPLAVEISIVSNFLLNNYWTFRESNDDTSLWTRMRRFHITAAGGFAINYAILWSVTEFLNVHYLLSNLLGILAAFLWNYAVNVKWTWRRAE
jgi:dolichol-phosphate mannosyltransferase